MRKPKLVITGYANHGKDTTSEFFRRVGNYKFKSSSEFAGEKVVYPVLKEKYGYQTFQECFDDRMNHRSEWFQLIRSYNADDLSRLGREIFEENDIYCGLRNITELESLIADGLIDKVIWVDASKRKDAENKLSITITPADADIIIQNNGTREELYDSVVGLIYHLEKLYGENHE